MQRGRALLARLRPSDSLIFAFGKNANESPAGERCDRCLWQKKGAERVAAVGEGRRCFVTEDIRRAPQQDTKWFLPYSRRSQTAPTKASSGGEALHLQFSTNYAVSICKGTQIIPQDLLLSFAML